MKLIIIKILKYFYLIPKIIWKIEMPIHLLFFRKTGKNILLGGRGEFSYSNISLGNNVFIGKKASFMASDSKIIIGNNVMIASEAMLISGDHRTNVLGSYMFDIKEKMPENDQEIIIQDDVWIGSRAIILKGVTIGKGSIIGAGSVVTKSIPPYSVVSGNPCKIIKKRFNSDQILRHEKILRET